MTEGVDRDRGARPLPARGLAALLADPRFEVVPMRGVQEQAAFLPPGATVTVTCSPRRGIEATLDLAERLAAAGHRAVPHVAARLVTGRPHLTGILRRLSDSGTKEIFVVGGDSAEPAGPYDSALGLLRDMAEVGHGLERIGVTAYPEGHPFVDNDRLKEALRAKQRFATHMVTQLCFDARTVATWMTEARADGVTLPAWVGMAGVVQRRKLIEISLRVGVGDTTRFIGKHMSIVARLMRRGSYRPDQFVDAAAELLGGPQHGVAGFHVNTFNQVQGTVAWLDQFRAASRWGDAESPDDRDQEETAS